MVQNKISLRDWSMSDKEALAYYANNKKIADNLRNVFPYPYTLENAEFYINMCINADASREYLQAIDVEGKAVGSIGLFIIV